jgi:hypothetical protein
MPTEIPEELLRLKSFLTWSPNRRSQPKPETVSVGHGMSFTYQGEIFTNLDPVGLIGEKHYSPADLAKAWSFDVETVRNIFRDEPGVLKIGDKNPRHKRPYLTLRIPESVAVRVHKRLTE